MKEMKKVYDFGDFETAVATANSGHVTVLPMEPFDFWMWLDCSSRTKRTSSLYLHEIVQVTAIRGSYDLHCKKSFSSSEVFCLDFLQKKFKKNGIPSPLKATANCGVPAERKNGILKLCSIMEVDKMEFWQNLTVTRTTNHAAKPKASKGNQRKKIQREGKVNVPDENSKEEVIEETGSKKTTEKKTGVKKAGVKKAAEKKAGVKKAGVKKTVEKKTGVKKAEVKKTEVNRKASVPKKTARKTSVLKNA